jgi:hypothetical protein
LQRYAIVTKGLALGKVGALKCYQIVFLIARKKESPLVFPMGFLPID